MKRIAIFLITTLTIISCSSKEKYVLKGKIYGSDGVTFYLKIRTDSGVVNIDSAVSKRGSFTMKGCAVEYPQIVALAAGNTNKMTSFYIENRKITVKGVLDSLSKAIITGSKTHDEYKKYIESVKPLSDYYQKLYADFTVARKAKDEELAATMRIQFDSIENEIIKKQKEFIETHTASFITPSFITGLSGNMSADELELYINNLDESISNLPQITELKKMVAAIRSVDVGKKAPDFTINDVKGDTVSLYSKVGAKALLIDFWAAWHSPCREENTNIVKVYNEFHKKGFDIISVSLDRQKEDWLKAVEDDKLTWTNVSDIKAWNSPVAALYAVNVIPANFLLDKNGIIIARNLSGDDLYNKVKDALEENH